MSLGRRQTLRASIASGRARREAATKPTRPQTLQRSRVDKLLSSRDGARAARLLRFLDGMKLADGAALLAFMQVDSWPDAELEARQLVLSIVNNRICVIRAVAGLPEIDDALEPDAANVCMKLRRLLAVP
jgi:hypothetical protein